MVLNTTEYENCKRSLLTVANIVSPTRTEQEAFVTLVHKMENAGESYEFVVTDLLRAIEDGMVHGNWPTP